MNEAFKFLKENPIQYFSTVGLDGRPKVRPFQFMGENEGKLYFCTSNEKEVFREISKTPYVETCACNSESVWIRLSGKVVFSEDMNIKEKIISENPLVKFIYKSADNPIFEIFYLEDAKAVIADFSGNPPREYNL